MAGKSARSQNRGTNPTLFGTNVSGKEVDYHTSSHGDARSEVSSATGGTKTTPGDGYHYHHFYATVPGAPYTKTPKSSETFVVSGGTLDCDYLIVGGGGAGGYDTPGSGGGGGGGAGAVYYATGVTLPAATYPVTVGGGGQNSEVGSDADPTPANAQGDDSVFNSITAAGGGRGGRGDTSPAPVAAGIAGGCGGGGGARYPGGPTPGGGGAGCANNANGPQVVSGAPDGPTPANDPWSPLARAGNTASGRGGCGLVQIRYPV